MTHFQKEVKPHLLFTGQCRRFEPTAPIRGRIPIVYPWFGKPEGQPWSHGLARLQDWGLSEMATGLDASLDLKLRMPDIEGACACSLCSRK